MKALHIEHTDDCYSLARMLLSKKGIDTVRALNDEEGLEIFREDPASFTFILNDMNNLNVKGYDFPKVFREVREDITVIAYTAHAFAADREKCMALGCNGCVVKPYEDLVKVVLENLSA